MKKGKKKSKSSDYDDMVIYDMPGIDTEDLEFIEDNEGKLSTLEMEDILGVNLRGLDEEDKKIIERNDAIYLEMQQCTDISRYKELCAEYAIISMKAARIKNRDDNAKARCVAEGKFHRIDK